jgi:hypothetical protein
MLNSNKLYFLFKLTIFVSFLLPTVTTQAAGSLKLMNASQLGGRGSISFYTGKTNENGYVTFIDKICVNDVLVNLKDYNFSKIPSLQQIENVYSGSLVNPSPEIYRLKYTETDDCKASKSKEINLNFKKYHQYELNLVENNSKIMDLFVKSDNYYGDVSIVISDKNIPYDGFTRNEVGSCLNNVLVSTLSQSSKVAFLTTTEEPGFPKVKIGENLISTYENDKCTDNSAIVDIKPNTSYYLEIQPNLTQSSILQSSTIQKKTYEQADVGRGASTIRTGGYSIYNFSFLPILIISLIQLFNLKTKPKIDCSKVD